MNNAAQTQYLRLTMRAPDDRGDRDRSAARMRRSPARDSTEQRFAAQRSRAPDISLRIRSDVADQATTWR
jgi:hypothetical protein